MDGSAERACFVLGVSFALCCHVFSIRSFLWCSYGPKLFTVDSMLCAFVPLCGHEPIVTSDGTFRFCGLQFAVHQPPHGRKRGLYGGVFDFSLAKIQNAFEMNAMRSRL